MLEEPQPSPLPQPARFARASGNRSTLPTAAWPPVGDSPLSAGSRCQRSGINLFAEVSPDSIAWRSEGEQSGAVQFDQSEAEAHGRITNPERFEVVVGAARQLFDGLVDEFDVQKTAGTAAEDFPDWYDTAVETVRLTPSTGAPLVFMSTEFPGVLVRFGEWVREAFPSCGCDACDEQPAEVGKRMNDLVEAVVEGRFNEELTKHRLRYSFSGSWGRSDGERRLTRGQWRSYGRPGTHAWPPWPKS